MLVRRGAVREGSERGRRGASGGGGRARMNKTAMPAGDNVNNRDLTAHFTSYAQPPTVSLSAS